MRVGLVVERRHLRIARRAIQALGLVERPVGLQPQRGRAALAGPGLQPGEDAAPDTQPARTARHPHALYLGAVQRAAADRLAPQARDQEQAAVVRAAVGGIEAEALVQLGEVLSDAVRGRLAGLGGDL